MLYCFKPYILLITIKYVRAAIVPIAIVISTRQRGHDTLVYQGKQSVIVEEVRPFNNRILFEDIPKKKAHILSKLPAKKRKLFSVHNHENISPRIT